LLYICTMHVLLRSQNFLLNLSVPIVFYFLVVEASQTLHGNMPPQAV
jgi:hypothetical protein